MRLCKHLLLDKRGFSGFNLIDLVYYVIYLGLVILVTIIDAFFSKYIIGGIAMDSLKE